MPELPEVETTRRGLEPVMKGKIITKVTVNRRDLRMPLPKNFEKAVAGQKVKALRRRAKYMLIDLANGKSILVHLGMSGSMRVVKSKDYAPMKHDHVIFEIGVFYVVFHDPRRFGLIDLLDTKNAQTHELLAHLGPEPLSDDFDANYLKRVLSKKKGPIKPVLMNQEVVVGVGNIYASEALFLSRIHPQAPADNLVESAEILVKSIKKVLESAIKSGGSTLRDYTQATGEQGYFQHHFNVYERKGEPCVACGQEVVHMVQAGRASYFCGACQPNILLRKKSRVSKG